ncbi:MAG: inorganic diphosphatase [Candidatus Cybelea sp.]|jgi:inorganic pyrophosphatase
MAINATHYDYIPSRPKAKRKRDHIVNAIIETPKASRHKYALMPEYGIIAFHDVLAKDLEWPYDYGFIPQTLAPDKDPVDILVVNRDGLFSGCLIQARVIGAIRETKDGIENDRLISIPLPSPGAPLATDGYTAISDLPKEVLERIKKFLVRYSSDQGHAIEISAVVGAREAMKTIAGGRRKFKKTRPA